MTEPSGHAAWEPLVQGRTFELDYSRNYLAVPGSLDPAGLERARGYVKGSRLSQQYAVMRRTARFCLFKDRDYCALGVSLPAGMVCDDRAATEDLYTRENYVFLGGVAPRDEALFPEPPHHPRIPDLDSLRRHLRAIFGPLHDEFVARRFREEPLPGNNGELLAVRGGPRAWFPPEVRLVTSAPRPLELNRDEGLRVKVWPAESEHELWAAACLAEPPVSLCLGVTTEKDALAGPFGNVTLAYSRAEKVLDRVAPPPPPEPAPGAGYEVHLKVTVRGRTLIQIDSTRSRRPAEDPDAPPPGKGKAGW